MIRKSLDNRYCGNRVRTDQPAGLPGWPAIGKRRHSLEAKLPAAEHRFHRYPEIRANSAVAVVPNSGSGSRSSHCATGGRSRLVGDSTRCDIRSIHTERSGGSGGNRRRNRCNHRSKPEKSPENRGQSPLRMSYGRKMSHRTIKSGLRITRGSSSGMLLQESRTR